MSSAVTRLGEAFYPLVFTGARIALHDAPDDESPLDSPTDTSSVTWSTTPSTPVDGPVNSPQIVSAPISPIAEESRYILKPRLPSITIPMVKPDLQPSRNPSPVDFTLDDRALRGGQHQASFMGAESKRKASVQLAFGGLADLPDDFAPALPDISPIDPGVANPWTNSQHERKRPESDRKNQHNCTVEVPKRHFEIQSPDELVPSLTLPAPGISGQVPACARVSTHGETRSAYSKLDVPLHVHGELIYRDAFGQLYLGATPSAKTIAIRRIWKPNSSTYDGQYSQQVYSYRLFQLQMFVEFPSCGSLAACLHTHGAFDQEMAKLFLRQIVAGLVYIHGLEILHGHLKADNILLDADGTCKIANFFVSKSPDTISTEMAELHAYVHLENTMFWLPRAYTILPLEDAVFWMAPEVIRAHTDVIYSWNDRNLYGAKVDIWGVGCILYEMWTGERPWAGLGHTSVLVDLYQKEHGPMLPTDVTVSLLADDFRRRCFVMDPDERPTAVALQDHAYLIPSRDDKALNSNFSGQTCIRVAMAAMAITLAPGVSFLARLLLTIAFAPLCMVIGSHALAKFWHLESPFWLVCLLAVISGPLGFLARVIHRRWSVRRAAVRFGAILPPEWVGNRIGNLDNMATMVHSFRSGYPSAIFKEQMDSFLGTGVFNSDGVWHRTMTRPFFSKDRISHFELFDVHAEYAIVRMRERLNAGYAVDFQDLISRFTMDSATEFLFGTCVESLRSPLPYPHNHFPTPFATQPTSQEALSRADAFSAAFLKSQHVIAEHPVVLHDETLNILLAGRDTVRERLRAEIIDRVGRSRRPTYADIKEMRYLRAVINETLRLYPLVPVNQRQVSVFAWQLNHSLMFTRRAINETTLPNPDPSGKPFYVPAGTLVTYSVLAMHRRPELWGPDADEFDPDRFLDERVSKYLTKNPFIFLPFNAGPRICLGQQFAYNEMSFFLVKLLQRFSSMELAPEAAPPESLPPADWAVTGSSRKRIDRFWPKSHLTMYSHVQSLQLLVRQLSRTETATFDTSAALSLRDIRERFVASLLPILLETSVLYTLSNLQRTLDPLDIEGLSTLWTNSYPQFVSSSVFGTSAQEPTLEEWTRFIDEYLSRTTITGRSGHHPDPQPEDLRYYCLAYLLSATFKDCSIMISMTPATGEQDAGRRGSVKIVDLDVKRISRLAKWERLDKEIVSAYATGSSFSDCSGVHYKAALCHVDVQAWC
ncbi:hypothetical protein POSPLADRAFT_1065282 [Postia placenta MAD-698-R-SB12]|uniref:Protein kinase domain-containing protein n=1 Tax=Postia placenta MAD-698-R-SB12 TaxID=670580 RepID=A0A1X6NA73_9APHY|nr:hypothetical protein POSPLADRAFT_1065282 [Postia placenta MAD-698-R-SB12]OSX65545.1 hypothetical protein POSPLADRAFT_1065282 [Postia placenta MAD-698-R-SB12]